MISSRSSIQVLFVFSIALTLTFCDYWSDRDELIRREESQILGANQNLSENELLANEILMKYKRKEYDFGFVNPDIFPPSRHFFQSKKYVEASEVFKIIQKLPKGASLHSHDSSLASFEYMYNLTYSKDLYACLIKGRVSLKFAHPNTLPNTTCEWQPIEFLRNTTDIDSLLRQQLTLIVDNPRDVYTDVGKSWKAFMNIFILTTPMLTYKPIWQSYFYEALKELHEDNVMYIEFRSVLPELYDLNGHIYGPVDVVGVYKETVEQFKNDYPDFQGARVIYAPPRRVTNETMETYVKTAAKLKKVYGNFVAGFDLVGQEDAGFPLADFVKELKEVSASEIKFFFHAGETNWYGSSTDYNLVDAVLLGTSRIGHGYAIAKHPEVIKLVKERGIAIEISPISNQVLSLVEDLRNHPANYYIAYGLPIVICNDDPGFWGAKGLSYDWYMAFMGMTSRESDLKLLKQLALNSYIYSAMEEEEKQTAIRQWKERWDHFIGDIIKSYNATGEIDEEYDVILQ